MESASCVTSIVRIELLCVVTIFRVKKGNDTPNDKTSLAWQGEISSVYRGGEISQNVS